eukprot:1159483-Pelagomonas_calceolata.AAC.14
MACAGPIPWQVSQHLQKSRVKEWALAIPLLPTACAGPIPWQASQHLHKPTVEERALGSTCLVKTCAGMAMSLRGGCSRGLSGCQEF